MNERLILSLINSEIVLTITSQNMGFHFRYTHTYIVNDDVCIIQILINVKLKLDLSFSTSEHYKATSVCLKWRIHWWNKWFTNLCKPFNWLTNCTKAFRSKRLVTVFMEFFNVSYDIYQQKIFVNIRILIFREQSCSCCTCILYLHFVPTFRRHCSVFLQSRPEAEGFRCYHLYRAMFNPITQLASSNRISVSGLSWRSRSQCSRNVGAKCNDTAQL